MDREKKPSRLTPHRWPAEDWQLMADSDGRPVGHYKSPQQPVREQVQVIREFLCQISIRKEEGKIVSTTEKVNMVWLAGLLKLDPKGESNNVRALIDVGMKSAIQVSVYTGGEKNNAALAEKLNRFRQGDFIKLVAILRPYGIKQQDDTWKNSMSIDVTEIKNNPPPRQQGRPQQQDDDIPF